MSDVLIRTTGRAGRITLNRPDALNALTHDMVGAIAHALDRWAVDTSISLLIIDATGDKAFCAGGDIADLYRTGRAGDFSYGQTFWRDEYRMNAKLFNFPKPVVTFLQGFVMGGGVGVGCHGSHRIVCETTQIAMPECGIGLVPDVGGSLLLARAPGRLGEYLGTTGHRMQPGDAIYSEFADYYANFTQFSELMSELCKSGDVSAVDEASTSPPASTLDVATIDAYFAGQTLGDIHRGLMSSTSDTAFREKTLKALSRNSPLSMACTVDMVHRLRGPGATIARALDLEYRFTARAMEHGDFLEGIRAAIIDKDKSPKWRDTLETVTLSRVSEMLRPLGQDGLNLELEP